MSIKRRLLLFCLIIVPMALLAAAFFFLGTSEPVPVNPAWAVAGSREIPDGAVTVRFTGTSTLVFSDGETSWMVDGWFTRAPWIDLVQGQIEPDVAAIERGLARNNVDRLAVVIPVHSHFDHAMDAPEVARRTGALLWGSESTANIGRGWGLEEHQIRVARDRETRRFGKFAITLIETNHFEFPDAELREQALSNVEIEAPLVPPVGMFDYRLGQAYAISVEHPRGRFLIQASAGFRPMGFEGVQADVVFLGIGGLGTQSADYREAYWQETVTRVGATRVVPIHWDSLITSIEGPLKAEVRAVGFLAGGTTETRAFLEGKEAQQPSLRFSTLPRYDEVVVF